MRISVPLQTDPLLSEAGSVAFGKAQAQKSGISPGIGVGVSSFIRYKKNYDKARFSFPSLQKAGTCGRDMLYLPENQTVMRHDCYVKGLLHQPLRV